MVETLTVECLRCGERHRLVRQRTLQLGECPRCGYLGWAEPRSLSEDLRRALRDVPVEGRRRYFLS
jgi:Zn ribbon nucleic-acid-binding protein